MTSTNYQFANCAFSNALHSLTTQPTAYEGLYRAWIDNLQWIEPEEDIPPAQRGEFLEWREGLLLLVSAAATPGQVLAAIRRLDREQLDNQVSKLQKIAGLIRAGT